MPGHETISLWPPECCESNGSQPRQLQSWPVPTSHKASCARHKDRQFLVYQVSNQQLGAYPLPSDGHSSRKTRAPYPADEPALAETRPSQPQAAKGVAFMTVAVRVNGFGLGRPPLCTSGIPDPSRWQVCCHRPLAPCHPGR